MGVGRTREARGGVGVEVWSHQGVGRSAGVLSRFEGGLARSGG